MIENYEIQTYEIFCKIRKQMRILKLEHHWINIKIGINRKKKRFIEYLI